MKTALGFIDNNGDVTYIQPDSIDAVYTDRQKPRWFSKTEPKRFIVVETRGADYTVDHNALNIDMLNRWAESSPEVRK